jgi:hypothetical protein
MRIPAAPLIVAACLGLAVQGSAQQAPSTYRQKLRTFHTAEEFAQLTRGEVKIHREASPGREPQLRRQAIQLPVYDFTVVAHETPGGVVSHAPIWMGTRYGAIRMQGGLPDLTSGQPTAPSREYFAGHRWLPDDHVTGFAFDYDGAVWIETKAGFARIEYRPMTLEDKSRVFVERVQARHNRWGLTADSQLQVPGDLSTNRTVSSDNDGLWTAMYVAAEAFRFKVTGAADARENARRGMDAILRLESITGIPGFPARSFIKTGEDIQPKDGEWHDTPDKVWRWKGDTSSDEIVGHYFVYPIYLDLVASDSEKARLRDALDRITTHILDHNFQLVDVDGQRTRWGWWGPSEIWEDPDETGLRALHILSHLRVAMHVTTNPERRRTYEAAYDDLVRNHRYDLLTRNQKIMVPGSINHSDDELAFLSYYPLLQYEKDPTLLKVYRQSLERSWLIERPERNPLWNVIYAAGTGAKQWDEHEALRTLRGIPMDQIQWSVRNSHRLDVPLNPAIDRHQHAQALIVLPYDELPMSKWNGNPYRLDGDGGGRSEDDGAYFLLPYWMGRYHGFFGN